MEVIGYKGRPFSVFVDKFLSHFALLQAGPRSAIGRAPDS